MSWYGPWYASHSHTWFPTCLKFCTKIAICLSKSLMGFTVTLSQLPRAYLSRPWLLTTCKWYFGSINYFKTLLLKSFSDQGPEVRRAWSNRRLRHLRVLQSKFCVFKLFLVSCNGHRLNLRWHRRWRESFLLRTSSHSFFTFWT